MKTLPVAALFRQHAKYLLYITKCINVSKIMHESEKKKIVYKKKALVPKRN